MFALFVTIALAAFAWITPVAAQQSAATVRGEVRSQETGRPLAGALIELSASSNRTVTISDSAGHYEFTGIRPGRSTLRVRYLGHEPLLVQVSVPGGEVVTLDLALAVQPVVLDPVGVDARMIHLARDSMRARDEDLGMAGTHALSGSPGLAEIGLGDAAGGVPDDPGDPGSVLYVRGATADLKLVYLDGAPVYAPFPLGGLLDPFTPGVLSRADIYLGGAPARYDGGLSYVMDLRSRASTGSGLRGEGAVDLLSARAMVDGGIGEDVSVLATARGVHPGASSAFLGEDLPYGYLEAFVRGDVRVNSSTTLNVSGFRNQERVAMGSAMVADSTIEWGNAAGSAQLRTVFGATMAEMTAAIGGYDAQLPLMDGNSLTAYGRSRRSRLAIDLTRPGSILLRYGASIDHQRYAAFTRQPDATLATAAARGTGTVAGAYAEVSGRVGARFLLRGGVRADHFSTGSEVAFAPRIAATWLISDRAALTLAAGRYHQFLRPPDETLLQATAEDRPEMATPMTVGSASHVAVGLDQDLGDGVRLGIEGFYKDFSDVPESPSMGANASGVDLWVRRSGRTWSGWLGYSLAWAWSHGPLGSYTDFTGRHLLSSGFSMRIGAGTFIDFRFAYGAGLPYSGIRLEPTGMDVSTRSTSNYAVTSPPDLMAADRGGTETAPLLQSPDRPFVRVDLAVSQLWTPRVAGRTFEIEPYLKLLNGLGRRDALFYYDGGAEQERPIGRLPVLPVAGLKWRF